jgi:hypothetical protein
MADRTKLDAALALAAMGFWVFPLKPKGKTPAHTGWQDQASNDPEVIKNMGFITHGYNVGIFTSKYGSHNGLLVVDVDNKGEKNGDHEILKLELEGRDFPATFTQRTPTDGRHLVYLVDEPVKQGANVLAPGLDIRSRGGYIVGYSSVLAIGAYVSNHHPIARAPQWLIDVCGRAVERPKQKDIDLSRIDAERASRRATEYLLNHAPVSIEGQGGDQTAYQVACRVKDFGVPQDQCLALMAENWNDRCVPAWDSDDLMDKVANAYSYGTEPVGAASPEAQFPPIESDGAPKEDAPEHPFDELNKRFAFVTLGGSAAILWEGEDAEGKFALKYLDPATFHLKFAAHKMRIETKKGVELTPVTKLWIQDESRRSFDGVVFRPGLPDTPGYYNMWRGFSVQPKEGPHPAVDMFLDHALNNVCGGDKNLCHWLIGYFAQMVQRPYEKPLVALVFKGNKGVGKNALVERVGYLLGSHFSVADDDRYLLSNFNGHMERMLFLVLDEAAWAGDKRAEGKLKGLITGSHHLIEHKGKEPYRVENRTRVAIIGNEDWLVPASHDERRFAVFNVGDGRKQDRIYFHQMRTGMERGGYGHLLAYLRDYDISGLDLNAAPATKGLYEQKIATLEPFPAWWLDCLTDGRIVQSDFGDAWPDAIECDRFRDAFSRYFRNRGLKRALPDSRSLGRTLRKICAPIKHDKERQGTRTVNVYELPPLDECRTAWENYIGHRGAWE